MNKTKHLTPLKAIKAHCLDCSGFERKEVKLCPITDCPLYRYRFGKTKLKINSFKTSSLESGIK